MRHNNRMKSKVGSSARVLAFARATLAMPDSMMQHNI
jgi:hypothetical protein